MRLEFGAKEWFMSVVSMLVLTDLVILLDIPFLRQILGFLFITLLPGLLIVQVLKINKLEVTEKVVLLVGLSISFLMFFGLFINSLSLIIGYKTPLATIPLLISFNIAFVALAIIEYKINEDVLYSIPDLNLTVSEKLFLIIPIFFPVLSIFGMHMMNTTNNNIILMLLIFLISSYVTFVCFFNQKFPERLYPVVIFLISISLLLLLSLRSNHIIGVDTHMEYYFFQTTLNRLHWSVFGHSTLDACLSISLLPTIYKSILNINSEFLFKILYSMMYSISPLIIYILSNKYIGEFYAFLASCFFMFQSVFLWTEYNARTNLAVLFFAFSMLVLFSNKIDMPKKRLLFIIFMASCIVSHYSTTYIFFFIMFVAFIGLKTLSKKYAFKKIISSRIVILFFIMIFLWYSQETETAFNAGVRFVEDTFDNLNMFFIKEMRSEPAQSLLGGDVEQGIPEKLKFLFTWLTFIFISIGVFTLIRRYREMSFQELNFRKLDFLRNKFEVIYFMLVVVCSGLSVIIISLPHVSVGYGMERAYSIVITILSVFFVIGGIVLSKHLKVQPYLIILLVLIPYFLCVTGVTYNIFGVPHSILLNSEGEQFDELYVHDQESFCAKWLKVHSQDKTGVYTDFHGRFGLLSQAGFSPNSVNWYNLVHHEKIDGYIYLRYYNVVNTKLVGCNKSSVIFTSYNLTEYDDVFVEKNNIYNNGGSEVHI